MQESINPGIFDLKYFTEEDRETLADYLKIISEKTSLIYKILRPSTRSYKSTTLEDSIPPKSVAKYKSKEFKKSKKSPTSKDSNSPKSTTKVKSKKSKKYKTPKDPFAPKKPYTTFIMFCKDYREDCTKQNPHLNPNDITRVLGDRWRSLSASERKEYNDRYEKAVEEYHHKVKEYKAKHSLAELQRLSLLYISSIKSC